MQVGEVLLVLHGGSPCLRRSGQHFFGCGTQPVIQGPWHYPYRISQQTLVRFKMTRGDKMKCQICGNESEEKDVKFCSSCGSPLPDEQKEPQRSSVVINNTIINQQPAYPYAGSYRLANKAARREARERTREERGAIGGVIVWWILGGFWSLGVLIWGAGNYGVTPTVVIWSWTLLTLFIYFAIGIAGTIHYENEQRKKWPSGKKIPPVQGQQDRASAGVSMQPKPPSSPSVIMYCPNCGNQLLPSSTFCNVCGEKVQQP